MTTLYHLLADRCGLSQREAALVLDVGLDSIKRWSSGRAEPPAGVIAELRALHRRIERAAEQALRRVPELAATHGEPDMIPLGIASTDEEAQQLGWPCVGAHGAVVGLVAARLDRPVRIVARGSTRATALAAAQTLP